MDILRNNFAVYPDKLTVLTFPTYRRLLTPLEQTTIEHIVTKGEIAQVNILSFIEIFHVFD